MNAEEIGLFIDGMISAFARLRDQGLPPFILRFRPVTGHRAADKARWNIDDDDPDVQRALVLWDLLQEIDYISAMWGWTEQLLGHKDEEVRRIRSSLLGQLAVYETVRRQPYYVTMRHHPGMMREALWISGTLHGVEQSGWPTEYEGFWALLHEVASRELPLHEIALDDGKGFFAKEGLSKSAPVRVFLRLHDILGRAVPLPVPDCSGLLR